MEHPRSPDARPLRPPARRALRALAVALLLAPAAVFGTWFLAPVFGRFEAITGIESLGHMGPSDWCYLAVYAALLTAAWALGAAVARRRRR